MVDRMSYTIAIDGPAASGKGTIAKMLAKKLNITFQTHPFNNFSLTTQFTYSTNTVYHAHTDNFVPKNTERYNLSVF